jgi:hypothetical protein
MERFRYRWEERGQRSIKTDGDREAEKIDRWRASDGGYRDLWKERVKEK